MSFFKGGFSYKIVQYLHTSLSSSQLEFLKIIQARVVARQRRRARVGAEDRVQRRGVRPPPWQLPRLLVRTAPAGSPPKTVARLG